MRCDGAAKMSFCAARSGLMLIRGESSAKKQQ